MPKLKLMSPSIKSLQQAITYLNPVTPICIHDSKTNSFREPLINISFSSSLSQPAKESLSRQTTTTTTTSPEPECEAGSIPVGRARFFFSPRRTKSIMEEEAEMATNFEESRAVEMTSEEPYRDFRASMEEMVEAHMVREWGRLEELLHCYLRLNDSKSHNVIVLAFMDVLMGLMAQDKDSSSYHLSS